MKTSEEMAKEFSEKFKLNEYSQYELEKLLDKMESQTKRDCAKRINKLSLKCDDHAQARIIWLDEAEKEIMNTKEV